MRDRLLAGLVLGLATLQPGGVLTAAAGAASHSIIMEGVAFVPPRLTVKRGDTVVWINKDLFAHTASAQDRSFESGEMAPGAKWTYVAARRGIFPYLCTLHPTMKGTLIVE